MFSSVCVPIGCFITHSLLSRFQLHSPLSPQQIVCPYSAASPINISALSPNDPISISPIVSYIISMTSSGFFLLYPTFPDIPQTAPNNVHKCIYSFLIMPDNLLIQTKAESVFPVPVLILLVLLFL